MESISDTVYIKFCSFCYFGIFKANIKKEIYIYKVVLAYWFDCMLYRSSSNWTIKVIRLANDLTYVTNTFDHIITK